MTVTDDDFVAELRTFLGTPYQHQGRLKGVGVDCAGLITVAAGNLGVSVVDQTDYARQRNGTTLHDALSANCTVTHAADRRVATIIEFQMDSHGYIRHLAVKTDIGMIHCWQTIGKVCEHAMDEYWTSRISNVWEIGGVTYPAVGGVEEVEE